MNQRIDQLAQEAGLHPEWFIDNPELEKFAELIIRECIEQFAHSVTDNTEIIQDRFIQCRKVAKHFGVGK